MDGIELPSPDADILFYTLWLEGSVRWKYFIGFVSERFKCSKLKLKLQQLVSDLCKHVQFIFQFFSVNFQQLIYKISLQSYFCL